MTRLLLLSAVLALVACDEQLNELLPQIRSELQPGTELHYIRAQTLDPSSDNVAYERWLRVLPSCQLGADGMYDLGSFSIERGDTDLSRIRLTAYRELDGKVEPVVEQRIDAVFQHGSSAVPFTFTRACNQKTNCASSTSCDPTSGECIGVSRLELRTAVAKMGTGPWCLERLDMPPDVTLPEIPDAGTPPLCVAGDRTCPPGCNSARDPDCRPGMGEPCSVDGEPCATGFFCRNGVCCDQPCEAGCERCDLPGQVGFCRTITYTEKSAPLSSPDFDTECADKVHYACVAGECSPACADRYLDCNNDLQANGCETPKGTNLNCRSCGEACTYGFCNAEQGCLWKSTRDVNTSSSTSVAAGRLYALETGFRRDQKKLRALGILVHPEFAGGSVRIAVYHSRGTIFELLAQSDELPTVDNPLSGVEVEGDVLRVEGRVTPERSIPPDGSFRIAFQVSEATQVYTEDESLLFWSAEPATYGNLPPQLSPIATVEEFPVFQVYAITTPE